MRKHDTQLLASHDSLLITIAELCTVHVAEAAIGDQTHTSEVIEINSETAMSLVKLKKNSKAVLGLSHC